jgi:hypothetical protein
MRKLIRLRDIPVPPMLEEALGYSGKSRYVAFYWEAAGDELVWEDGRAKLIGANWPAWLIFVRHCRVARHLAPYQLGSSESEAAHKLLLDRQERTLYVGERKQVARFLAQYVLLAPVLSPEQIQNRMQEKVKRSPPDRAEVRKRIEEETQGIAAIQSWLDR